MSELKQDFFTADAVANHFLQTDAGKITQLQLQKLCYISHGLYMAIHDKPLIGERVEAWKYGPVIRSLRNEFRNFGSLPITRLATKPARMKDGSIREDFPSLDKENHELAGDAKFVLNEVKRIYGHMSGPQLSTLTHQKGSPWYSIYEELHGGNPPPGEEIPNEVIKDYYKKLLEGTKK